MKDRYLAGVPRYGQRGKAKVMSVSCTPIPTPDPGLVLWVWSTPVIYMKLDYQVFNKTTIPCRTQYGLLVPIGMPIRTFSIQNITQNCQSAPHLSHVLDFSIYFSAVMESQTKVPRYRKASNHYLLFIINMTSTNDSRHADTVMGGMDNTAFRDARVSLRIGGSAICRGVLPSNRFSAAGGREASHLRSL